jgi:hypothetical protein
MLDQPTSHARICPAMCPDCLKLMQYRMSVPHEKYFMLSHVMFVCGCCGRVCAQLVAKSMLAISPMQVF